MIINDIEINNLVAIPYKLKQELINCHQPPNYYYNTGRLLKDTLSYTLNHKSYTWYSDTTERYLNFYSVLTALCANYLNKHIKFFPRYISRTDISTATDLESYQGFLRNSTMGDINIHIVHAPTNITLQKSILKDIPEEKRIATLENYLILDGSHFIRVYKNFNRNNDYVIITSHIPIIFIERLIALLPHLLEIKPVTNNTNDMSENKRQYNEILFTLFSAIFNNIFNNLDRDAALNTVLECINAFDKLITIGPENINKFFTNAQKTILNKTRAKLQSTINSTQSSIDSYERSLNDYYERLYTANKQLQNLDSVQAADYSQIAKDLCTNKAVELISVTGQNIRFKVTAPLQHYIASDFEAYERNKANEYNSRYRQADKDLLHNIFITQKYSIILQGIINLRIGTATESVFDFSASNAFSEYTEFPNPHLFHYNCWSKARTEIAKNFHEGNIELVIPQIIAAVQSINVAENASFYRHMLLNDLRSSEYREKLHLIKNETNEILTWEEALIDIAKENTPTKEETQGYTQTVISEEEITESTAEDDNNETD